ncbi:hypothetical protein AALA22_08745 [Anaerovoracaceae bacterium 41-7]
MGSVPMKTRIKHKRDTATNWGNNDPVILNGEVIIVDTSAGEIRTKTGDGIKTYTQLPFDDEVIRNLINSKAQKSTTLAGYGILDAYTASETDNKINVIKKELLGETSDNLIDEEGFLKKTIYGVYNWVLNKLNLIEKSVNALGITHDDYIRSEDKNTLKISQRFDGTGDDLRVYFNAEVNISPDTDNALVATPQGLKVVTPEIEQKTQVDWNVTDTTSDAYIKNKPDIPSTKNFVQKTGDTMGGMLSFQLNNHDSFSFSPFIKDDKTHLSIGTDTNKEIPLEIMFDKTKLNFGTIPYNAIDGAEVSVYMNNSNSFHMDSHYLNGGIGYFNSIVLDNGIHLLCGDDESNNNGLSINNNNCTLGNQYGSPNIIMMGDYDNQITLCADMIIFDKNSMLKRVVFSDGSMKNEGDLSDSGFCFRNIQISTSEPTSSDGINGDIWIQYE